MNTGAKIATAVVGGYVLGRRKKAKLAIAMGAWLVGKKLNLNPQKLLTDVTHQLTSSPQLSGLRDQVRDEMLSAGKTMATAIVARQVNKVTSSLQDRTESLLHGPEEGVEKGKETAKKASKGLRGKFTRRGRGEGEEDVDSAEEGTSEEFDEAAEDESDVASADETGAESNEVDEDRDEEVEPDERAAHRRRPAGARRPATTGRSSKQAGPSPSETSPAKRSAPRESFGRSQPASRTTASSGKSTSTRRSGTSQSGSSAKQSGSSATQSGSSAKRSGSSAKHGTTAERR